MSRVHAPAALLPFTVLATAPATTRATTGHRQRPPRARRRVDALAGLGAVCIAALLAACGTRGPVVPEPAAPVAVKPAPITTPAPPVPTPRSAGPVAAPPTPPLARAPYPGPDGPEPNPPAGLHRVPDAVPRIEPLRAGSPNVPYAIKGQTYPARAVDEPVRQTGVASWYGRKFHGQRTANGEVYNMYAMTAAHPTLPIPSYARVRNRANGREVIVRINDRGPFKAGRIIDLSYTAALKLGFVKDKGTAQVEVERLTHEAIRTGTWRNPNPLADPPSGGGEGWGFAWLDGLWGVSAAVSLGGRTLGRAAFSPLPAPLWPLQPGDATGGERDDSDVASATEGATAGATAPAWWLQLGDATDTADALALQRQASRREPAFAPLLAVVSVATVTVAAASPVDLVALQAGPFPTRDEARAAAQRLSPNESPQLLQRR
jgi:rare lipoprotein A